MPHSLAAQLLECPNHGLALEDDGRLSDLEREVAERDALRPDRRQEVTRERAGSQVDGRRIEVKLKRDADCTPCASVPAQLGDSGVAALLDGAGGVLRDRYEPLEGGTLPSSASCQRSNASTPYGTFRARP